MNDEEIDGLAMAIELKIQEGRKFIDSMPDFEEGRIKRRSNTVVNAQEILTGQPERRSE